MVLQSIEAFIDLPQCISGKAVMLMWNVLLHLNELSERR